MALNPFFLHGSPSEQRLVQQLINEQLRMYGVEVIYIPRKFVNESTIFKEISSSKFNDNFSIEAYVNTYDGYSGAGDIMTKFGVSLKDELIVTISKERFEDFIAPFLEAGDDEEISLSSRPREGDLIYFPLGQRIFEVKFVEHEQPFYQLGKLYVYELKCELFEYEDEIIETGIDEVDKRLQDEGYITTLTLVGTGRTASVTASINDLQPGYVRQIFLNNDGSGYTSTPEIKFTPSPFSGGTAQAVAITTSIGGIKSIKEILLTNAGYGYTTPPIISIIGGNGIGAAATCSVETNQKGIVLLTINDAGEGYTSSPTITVSGPIGSGVTATVSAIVNANNQVSSLRITNPGIGYTEIPTVTVSNPQIMTGIGTYFFNEVVVGSLTNAKGRVKEWNNITKKLKISVVSGEFARGEILVGTISSARYSVSYYDEEDIYNKYDQNDEIEAEADFIVDFSESNPFGTY